MKAPPNVIYEYDLSYKLERCKRTLELHVSEPLRREAFGTRWRFRGAHVDFYGWDSIRAAKQDALMRCNSELLELQKVKAKLEQELKQAKGELNGSA